MANAEAGQTKERNMVEFPMENLEHMNGFSMDFGSSAMKIAYLSKEDWEERAPGSREPGKVRLVSFSRENFDEGLEFLKKNCFMKRSKSGDAPLMFTYGLSGNQFGKRIEEELNVRTKSVSEWSCFAATLEYLLEHAKLEDFCLTIPKELTETMREETSRMNDMYRTITEKGFADLYVKENVRDILDGDYDASSNVKPYLMGIFGSGFLVLSFDSHGRQSMVTSSRFAGRSFLGLGHMLTGAQSYEELMALAEKGSNAHVDTMRAGAITKSEDSKEEDDAYSAFRDRKSLPEPRPIFMFGQGVTTNPGEFRKEDVARALLYTMCNVAVTTAFDACLITKTKHIFIGGGFVAHPLAAKIIMQEFEFKRWYAADFTEGMDGDFHLHIMKDASYLGALGAFLYQKGKDGDQVKK